MGNIINPEFSRNFKVGKGGFTISWKCKGEYGLCESSGYILFNPETRHIMIEHDALKRRCHHLSQDCDDDLKKIIAEDFSSIILDIVKQCSRIDYISLQ